MNATSTPHTLRPPSVPLLSAAVPSALLMVSIGSGFDGRRVVPLDSFGAIKIKLRFGGLCFSRKMICRVFRYAGIEAIKATTY